MALDFSHAMMPDTAVLDKEDFFRSGLPEMHSLKSLINVSSRLFKIPTTNIILSVWMMLQEFIVSLSWIHLLRSYRLGKYIIYLYKRN